MQQTLTLTETINIIAEGMELKDQANGKLIEGIALVANKPSRNGVIYSKESIEQTYTSLKGRPLLFNHDENKVIGHVEEVWFKEDKLYYRANIDPEEKDIIRKLERGDIGNVSIRVIAEAVDYKEDNMLVNIKDFLELSIVTIPGFADTTIHLLNAYKEEIDKRYQNPDGTFKKMTCPDDPNGDESKFCGCVRYMMSKKGMSLDSAKKLCAYIKRKKYGASLNYEQLADFIMFLDSFNKDEELNNIKEVDNMSKEAKAEEVIKQEQEQPSNEQPNIEDVLNDIKAQLQEIMTRLTNLEDKVKQLESDDMGPEEEKLNEEKEERLSVEVPAKAEKVKITPDMLKEIIKEAF